MPEAILRQFVLSFNYQTTVSHKMSHFVIFHINQFFEPKLQTI